jgi:hypothetical protein
VLRVTPKVFSDETYCENQERSFRKGFVLTSEGQLNHALIGEGRYQNFLITG